jgi:hypothetical protein
LLPGQDSINRKVRKERKKEFSSVKTSFLCELCVLCG